MYKKYILITGCAGFIGYHLVQKLKNQFTIIGIDNLNNYYDVELKKNRLKSLKKIDDFEFFKYDLVDKNNLIKLFSNYKFDFILHLAAQAGVRYSLSNPQKYIDSNITGFLNLLELCKNNKSKIIYASSSSVYGANSQMPFNEKQKTDSQLSLYGITKKTNEMMAYTYSNLYNIKTIGLRFFTVYGPLGRPDMSYYKFTKSICNDEPIQVYNNGNHSRSFTYIEDIINSIDLLLNKFNGIVDDNLVLNIGGNETIKLMDYIRCIENYLNKKANIEFLPMQLGDIQKTEADISLLESKINYVPKISIDEGISKFIDWYKEYYGIK